MGLYLYVCVRFFFSPVGLSDSAGFMDVGVAELSCRYSPQMSRLKRPECKPPNLSSVLTREVMHVLSANIPQTTAGTISGHCSTRAVPVAPLTEFLSLLHLFVSPLIRRTVCRASVRICTNGEESPFCGRTHGVIRTSR